MNEKKIEEKKEKIENQLKNIEEILPQEISYIKSELSKNIKEFNSTKENLIKLQKSYNASLIEYKSKKNLVIEKEQEIESKLIKISKLRKKLLISINQSINNKFYNTLQEILSDKQKEKSLFQFFNFILNLYNFSKVNIENIKEINLNNNENENMKNILKILKNDNEIRVAILYSYEIIQNLYKEESDIYNNIKKMFLNLLNELNNEQKQYPIDILYDYIKNIFTIVDLNNDVNNTKIILNNLTLEKNTKFIEINKLQSQIQSNIINKKLFKNNISTLNSFIARIKELEIKKSNNEIQALIDDIEKYKKLIIKNCINLNNNFDIMTLLSLESNFSLNDKSLIKSNLVENKKSLRTPEKTINEYEENNINENQINNKKSKMIKTKNYLIMNKNKKNTKNNFQKLQTESNIYKKENNNMKKILYMKKGKKVNENNNISMNYKTLNKNANKNIDNVHNLTTNDIKDKTQDKKEYVEKSFNKINKNKFIYKNLKNRNEKSLISQLKSQKITKTKINNMKKSKNFHTLNNIIFNNNTKEYYINQDNNNKNNIISKKKEIIKNFFQNKEKILNFSAKKEEIKSEQNTPPLFPQNLNKSENDITKKNNDNSINNKDQLNTEEINNNKESFYLNEKKDSICDEMISKNLEARDILFKTKNNNYINKLGKKQNIIWSENLYNNNKIMKYKNNNKNFNIDKPIDAFACCTSCT